MYSADAESRGVIPNGFPTIVIGRAVIGTLKPMSLRILLPLLMNWRSREIPEQIQYGGPIWVAYQTVRFFIMWGALWLVDISLGTQVMLVTAGLFGLTLRFDYWSNCVELLAVAAAIALNTFHIPWIYGLAAGLVLGTGRETIPLIALMGTPAAMAMGFGAAASQLVVRYLSRNENDDFKERRCVVKYGWYGGSSLRWNWEVIMGGHIIDKVGIAVFLAILIPAAFIEPRVAVALLAVTVPFAHINEARLATLLIPFAAESLCKLIP